MSETNTKRTKISSFVWIIIVVTLAFSLAALLFALNALNYGEQIAALYLFIIGFAGATLSTYMLFNIRRRLSKLQIKIPPVVTVIECQKCNLKSVREFKRGDYVFKKGEKCQKCDDETLITGIYREIKTKEK
jgi:hypothetical protein